MVPVTVTAPMINAVWKVFVRIVGWRAIHGLQLQIGRACREHVTFFALCGGSAPRFTTIAQFVRTLDGQWKCFCLVHNVEQLANNGDAA